MLNQISLLGTGDGLALGNMLYLLVAFAFLMVLVKKFAWGPVTQMMDERAKRVAHDLDSAEEARIEAQALQQERQAALVAARNDANRIIADAKAAGTAQMEQIVAEAQTKAQDVQTQAAAQIAQDRQEALNAAKNDVAELSITIAQKMMQKELDIQEQKALIDAYIDGLGAQANGKQQ